VYRGVKGIEVESCESRTS